MICYKDRSYCASEVEVHTCGREFKAQDAIDAERWWGGKGYPVAYGKFCEAEVIHEDIAYLEENLQKIRNSYNL